MLSGPKSQINSAITSNIAFDVLPTELQEIILFEMGLKKEDFLKIRLVSKAWNGLANSFGKRLIQKYFPYLLNTQSDNCKKAALPAFYHELRFFIKTFPQIKLQLLLAALCGDKATIMALADNNDKAILIGILLSNHYEVEQISETCKQTAYNTAFMLCANNGNIALLQEFQKQTISKESEEPAISYAVKRGDLPMVKAITGLGPFYYSSYYIVQAMAQDHLELALYLHRGNAPAKPRELESILSDIFRYDNHNALINTAKHPDISHAVLEKELLAIDVAPRVRKWLLQALKEKYQQSNYWIPTLFGYGHSIWNVKKTFSDHFKSWTTSLLIWFIRQDDNSLISFYLSLADKNAWDWKFACNAKSAALHYAAKYAKPGPLEVLLADQHVPLSIKAKNDALACAHHPAIIQMLKDSIDEQSKQEKSTSTLTIWDAVPTITFRFCRRRSCATPEPDSTKKPTYKPN